MERAPRSHTGGRVDLFVALAIAATTLLHRMVAWSLLGRLIDGTVVANGDWLTWQYLPLDVYRQHFWESLLYLQQTPPLPHVLFAAVARASDWPFGVTHTLLVGQALISAA